MNPEPWREQAEALTHVLTLHVPALVGVYLHGSAALGGFGPSSDLDVLVVADAEADWAGVGDALLVASRGGRPLELSVVDARAAAEPAPPWPFLLHVNSGDGRCVLGGEGGDPDLIAHYAVVRAAGIRLDGAEPSSVIGAVDRAALLDHLIDELRWGRDEADQRYAVLNSCRAVAYAQEGTLSSKMAGGAWWLKRFGPTPLVTAALQAQRAGIDLGPCAPPARAFVEESIARLAGALGS